jgi:hypothetical protein
MYKKLFEKNKKALEFLKEKESMIDEEIKSLAPICKTKLYCKTIVGIADLMTNFAEYLNRE